MPQQHSCVTKEQREIVFVVVGGQITIAHEANDSSVVPGKMFIHQIE
jgi:hypothetical protein